MRLERIGTPANARFCIAVSARANHYASRASITTPESDTTDKGSQLAAVEAPGVLGTQPIEQLACIDVRPCIEAAAHRRPDQCKRVTSVDVTFRELSSLKLAPSLSFSIQDWCGWRIQREVHRSAWSGFHQHNLRLRRWSDLT
jgi:hypothetical protein